jgi:hypothetical protein
MKDFKTIEIPPEHKVSLGATFKYLEDKVLEEEWEEKLKERKKMYNASGRGIDFNKERTDERMQKLSEDMKTQPEHPPSTDIAGVCLPSAFGADIEAEQVFQQELHGIVDQMNVKLVDEKKILEGTLNPEYGKGDWGLPHIDRVCSNVEEMLKVKHIQGDCETADGKPLLKNVEGGIVLHRLDTGVVLADWKNELSNSNPVEEQWKNDSPNGSLIIDLTPTSTRDSSSSSFTAEASSPSFPTLLLRRPSTTTLDGSWTERLVVSGAETVVMNESLDSMEQTINVPMAGMLSGAK